MAMNKFISSIQQLYTKRLLEREESWPPVNGKKLINLELVETDKKQGYRSDKTMPINESDKKGKIIKRSPITLEDLFKGKEPVSKVIIEGNAGMGKTTLCIMLAEGWAAGKILTQFDCVLLFPLRDTAVSSATQLPQLLKILHSDEKICDFVMKELFERQGEHVLIIADGWDELEEKNRSKGSFLHELLFGNIICFVSVLLTSRPSASFLLHKLRIVDRLVEVIGFNEENVEEYIISEFEHCPKSGMTLIEHLENNPIIQNVCSVPLNCSIICFLWGRDQVLPSTLTKLYSKMIQNVILRNIKKKMSIDIEELDSFDMIPKDLQSTFWLTCKFAYECLAKDQIVFSKNYILSTLPEVLKTDSNFLCFGLLQSAQSLVASGHKLSFHFLHLTFQEFLAALYLATLPNEEKLELCNTHGKKDRFVMVWRFLFGLSSRKQDSFHSSKVIQFNEDMVYGFVTAIIEEEDEVNVDFLTLKCKNTMLLYHCALESEDALVSKYFASILDGQFDESYDDLYDCMAVLHILRYTTFCDEVVIDLSHCGLSNTLLFKLTDILTDAGYRLKIQKLNLNNNKITDDGVTDLLCRASLSLSSLSELSLDDNNIKDIMTPLMSVNCKTLTDLSLSNNFLGATGIQSLLTAVDTGYLPALTQLDLTNTFTDDTDINGALLITLLTSITTNRLKLNSLYLSKNNLGIPGPGALGEALPLLTCNEISGYHRFRLELNEVNFNCEAMASFSSRLLSSNIQCSQDYEQLSTAHSF